MQPVSKSSSEDKWNQPILRIQSDLTMILLRSHRFTIQLGSWEQDREIMQDHDFTQDLDKIDTHAHKIERRPKDVNRIETTEQCAKNSDWGLAGNSTGVPQIGQKRSWELRVRWFESNSEEK